MSRYDRFLESKIARATANGFDAPDLNPALKPFQSAIVKLALKKGRYAIFADTGLGKTLMQLEWARCVADEAGPVLLLAPLAVAEQTAREAAKFGIDGVEVVEEPSNSPIQITNYEKLHRFTPDRYSGIVIDESSILKGFTSKYRKALTDFSSVIGFRLPCSATPAPNDYMELGNHAEFLGVMTCAEMLSMFFTHDGGDTSKWRLKGHAESKFWKWVASWAVAIRKPSDIGFSDDGYDLRPLHTVQHTIKSNIVQDGRLFTVEAENLQERQSARKETIGLRIAEAAKMVNESSDQWLVWCGLNSESVALTAAIDGAVEITGSDTPEHKRDAILDFINGKVRVIVTKPEIAGFGLNLQCCRNMVFVGLSDSYEQFYQAVRRCWRFGQDKDVFAHVITTDLEGAVVRNIERKDQQSKEMMAGMVNHMKDEMKKNIGATVNEKASYVTNLVESELFSARLGDCVETMRSLDSDSIHYQIFSPPFSSLYTYSNSERDMGNCRTYNEFIEHFSFLAPELFRVLMPGRLMSFHCMNLPLSKERDGVIGIRDFRGILIKLFQDAGFIFHSEVCIWKDPVTVMQRTKAIGLLYKQLRKDSSISRQGIPDYLVTMRKPGENQERVTKTHESFPVDLWQRYASPVWMDIDQSETLNRDGAREEEDERHICPLQLGVIKRGIELWTNPSDIVLSPFMGIGSEGYSALKLGRRFVGIELKQSYFNLAVKNLKQAEQDGNGQGSLYGSEHLETVV
jgi:superfamily II DNA or RNA helicase